MTQPSPQPDSPSADLPDAPPPQLPVTPASTGHSRSRFWHHFRHNLGLGWRAALFFPFSMRAQSATWHQLIALVTSSLLLQLIWDFLHVGRAGEWALNAAPGALFLLPVLLIAAWALTSLFGRTRRTLNVLVLFYALSLPIDLVYLLATQFLDRPLINQAVPNWGALTAYVSIFWLALSCALASQRLLQVRRRRLLGVLLALLCIAGPLSQVYLDRSLWVRPVEESMASQTPPVLNTEDIFYAQPQLLEQAINGIKPGPANQNNLYFVGAAGYADQDVFMKEVEYVQQLLRQRYALGEQSILLINNPKTADRLPIASVTSLRLALQKVGSIMNPEQDVLFLYLSSHGSKDFKFALEFGNFQFNELDPEVLREMLDEAGIEKRVIVISACYAGGFIDALKDDNTLVITAAAADKTSFGCSNEADFTYFGDAYFNQALHQTHSFVDAFALAKKSIAEREKKEGYESSDPQMVVGRQIGKWLADFSRHHPLRRE